MSPEDVYFWFLPPNLRMVFALGIIFLLAVALVLVLLSWMFSKNRRDD